MCVIFEAKIKIYNKLVRNSEKIDRKNLQITL